ncbi:MAG: YihY/virulence factor BrkB family protein [Ignavibacteriae bacterium]|nr:YihY/virulence factor BrkB family protein [Ignavibacteriota bacterium]
MSNFDKNKVKKFFSSTYSNTIYYSKKLYEKFEKDHIWVLSSGIAFNILISIIPFLLIALTVLGIYIDSSNVLEKINSYLTNILPMEDTHKDKIIMQIFELAKELTNNTFLTGSIGIIALMWTMSGLFSTMRDVLNRIFVFDGYINFFYGKLRDFALVLVTLTLFLISLFFTSIFQIFELISKDLFGEIIPSVYTSTAITIIASLITTYIMFLVMYKYIPQFKLPIKVIQLSTLLSTILFELMKYLYTLYVLRFSSLKRIYGAYAFIVISIFWIYYISVIFSTSAAIGSIYLEKNGLKPAYKRKKS